MRLGVSTTDPRDRESLRSIGASSPLSWFARASMSSLHPALFADFALKFFNGRSTAISSANGSSKLTQACLTSCHFCCSLCPLTVSVARNWCSATRIFLISSPSIPSSRLSYHSVLIRSRTRQLPTLLNLFTLRRQPFEDPSFGSEL